jgi:TPR repeat protein
MVLITFFAQPAAAQQKPPPNPPLRAASSLLLYPSGPTRVVETFSLLQEANAGTPAAQHELGYRYLLGRGVASDSVRGAAWILTAAENNMALAQFNAGILFTHALGVEWDPFKAYRWFKRAADQQLPAAQFILGILHTDGLVIPRDYARAYALVKTSFDQGYTQAEEALEEFRRRGFDTLRAREATIPEPSDSSSQLVLLHFEDVGDPNVGDTVLVHELAREVRSGLLDSASTASLLADTLGQSKIRQLTEEAERGIPEAHMILGRMYEKGIGVGMDPILAAVRYLRANRLDSPRAPAALINLIQTDTFRQELMKRAQEKDDDARFVWASLSAIEFDDVIGWEQALRFLEEQSGRGDAHLHSCIELGFWYASGRNVSQDPFTAMRHWSRADSLGSPEGMTRIALVEVIMNMPGERKRTAYLKAEAEEGSILAQAGYAYCLLRGIGTGRDKPEAATWYRRAAQRGSIAAFTGLKRMYDELRPADEEFRVD